MLYWQELQQKNVRYYTVYFGRVALTSVTVGKWISYENIFKRSARKFTHYSHFLSCKNCALNRAVLVFPSVLARLAEEHQCHYTVSACSHFKAAWVDLFEISPALKILPNYSFPGCGSWRGLRTSSTKPLSTEGLIIFDLHLCQATLSCVCIGAAMVHPRS